MPKSILVSNVLPQDALALIPSEIRVDYHASDSPLSKSELIARLRDRDGLICHIISTIDEEVLAAAPALKVVANVAVVRRTLARVVLRRELWNGNREPWRNLWSRDPEGGNIQACREFNMGFMAYSPLGRGFFAGAVHDARDMSEGDGRSGHPRFQPGNLEKNLELLRRFEEFAREKGATPAQLALAWLMAQGPDIIPIPSNKTREHLEENIRATETKLSKEDVDRLDAIFPPGAAAGPRSRDMHRVNV